MLRELKIYTDGSCKGNPGYGGWGAILKYKENKKEIYGGENNTTNNRMELTATIKALSKIKQHNCNIIIYTDSKYVKYGITQWIYKWIKNKWKTSSKKPVKNKDLWQKLYEESRKHKIQWKWIKSHNNDNMNNLADLLAKKGAKEIKESTKKVGDYICG